jgi:SAM-dependent methyltransferase
MSDITTPKQNWFDQGGKAYAQYRPEYPPSLVAYLTSLCTSRTLAVDVGCGNGQLTRHLAEEFQEVAAFDPSLDQLAHAAQHAHIHYACASAEKLPLAAGRANLVTVAQAVHWFRLEEFYAEVRRIAAPDAILALLCYGTFNTDERFMSRINQFYAEELGPYWPPERLLIEAGYASLPFPFREQKAPPMEITLDWNLDQLLGYLSTWSAVRRAREAGKQAMLADFDQALRSLWGAPETVCRVRWPLHLRLGYL